MKISSTFDYALSCILRVADGYGKRRPVTVTSVSRKENLARDYAEQLLIKMKKAGLLKSVRGQAGGYILSRPPNKITVKDVLEAVEIEVLELICYREKGRQRRCAHFKDCKIRNLWIELRKEIESFLNRYTIKGLLFLRRKEKNW